MPDIFGKKQSEGKWHAIRNGESLTMTCREYLRLRQLLGDHAKPAIDDQVKSGHREKA
jgi:hypothetical protein